MAAYQGVWKAPGIAADRGCVGGVGWNLILAFERGIITGSYIKGPAENQADQEELPTMRWTHLTTCKRGGSGLHQSNIGYAP